METFLSTDTQKEDKALIAETFEEEGRQIAAKEYVQGSPEFSAEIINKLSPAQQNDLSNFLGKSLEEIQQMVPTDLVEDIIEKIKKPEGIAGVIAESRVALLSGGLFGCCRVLYQPRTY